MSTLTDFGRRLSTHENMPNSAITRVAFDEMRREGNNKWDDLTLIYDGSNSSTTYWLERGEREEGGAVGGGCSYN